MMMGLGSRCFAARTPGSGRTGPGRRRRSASPSPAPLRERGESALRGPGIGFPIPAGSGSSLDESSAAMRSSTGRPSSAAHLAPVRHRRRPPVRATSSLMVVAEPMRPLREGRSSAAGAWPTSPNEVAQRGVRCEPTRTNPRRPASRSQDMSARRDSMARQHTRYTPGGAARRGALPPQPVCAIG